MSKAFACALMVLVGTVARMVCALHLMHRVMSSEAQVFLLSYIAQNGLPTRLLFSRRSTRGWCLDEWVGPGPAGKFLRPFVWILIKFWALVG